MTQLPIEQEYSAVLAASVNYKRRAEAAEARAATAERQNEIYAAELDALAQRELRIRSERDEARLELQQIRTMLDNGIDETAIDMVTRLYATLYASQRTVDEVTSERDEARRQLEQAQQQIAELTKKARHVWLDDALNEGDGVYRP